MVKILFIRPNELGNVGNLNYCGFDVHKPPHVVVLAS